MRKVSLSKTGPVEPWKLPEKCKVNNSKLNFFVKMVHVDRYADEESKLSFYPHIRQVNKSQSRKFKEKSEINSYLIPTDIVNNLPIWNHHKRATKRDEVHSEKRIPMIVESLSPGKQKIARKFLEKEKQRYQMRESLSPSKHKRFQTEYGSFKIAGQERKHMRMATAPNESYGNGSSLSNKKMELKVNDISLQSNGRRPKVGEMLLHRSGREDILERRIRKKINKAKIRTYTVLQG